jgi:acetyltransferase-like isoleucine patch superfamily enzyme
MAVDRISAAASDIRYAMIANLPGGLGYRLRHQFWKSRLKSLGERVRIDVGVWFTGARHITIEDDAWIDRFSVIMAGRPSEGRIIHRRPNPDFHLAEGEVHIGRCVHISPSCVVNGIGGVYIGTNAGLAAGAMVYSFSNHYRNLEDRSDKAQYSFTPCAPASHQAMISSPVVIGDYCGVGSLCVVLPGSSLLEGSWLASGTLLSGRHPPRSILSAEGGKLVRKDISDLEIKR